MPYNDGMTYTSSADAIGESKRLLETLDPDFKSNFEVLAVRCNAKDSTGRRKLIPNKIYYLVGAENTSQSAADAREIFNLFMSSPSDPLTRLLKYSPPCVKVSAIVGKNGSGKSSLIEFLMRLINNLAASLIGEVSNNPASAHLHYIEGVKGDMWYRSAGKLFRLNVTDRAVGLYEVSDDKFDSTHEKPIFLENQGSNEIKGGVHRGHEQNKVKECLRDFFYTVIINYSIYAYNTRDFYRESDSDEKTESLRRDYNVIDKGNENRNWIHGLFHKNDGYRTPLVITPARHEGNININRENSLANERLLWLLISTRNLRNINEHLVAEAMILGSPRHNGYGYDYFVNSLDLTGLSEEDYMILYDLVLIGWNKYLPMDLKSIEDIPYLTEALNYLVYKTIKIALTYPEYMLPEKEFDFENPTKFWYAEHLINDIVERQVHNNTHITRKVFRTLAYLIFNVYPSFITNLNEDVRLEFEAIRKRWENQFGEYSSILSPENKKVAFMLSISNEVILPPPFLESRILLHEVGDPKKAIFFETLSSGERELAYAVSSILYHLTNIDSAHRDMICSNRVRYRNVLLILEEVELYFHPEFQQRLIKLILQGIRDQRYDFIRGIHIILATHSPYVLSDIPKHDILALNSNGMPAERALLSFGANIHDMLRDSFFLSNGARGALAQWTINVILTCLEIHRGYRENEEFTPDPSKALWNGSEILDWIEIQERGLDYEQFNATFSEAKLRKWIFLIDEPIIRNVLSLECDDIFQKTELERLEEQKRLIEIQIEKARNQKN